MSIVAVFNEVCLEQTFVSLSEFFGFSQGFPVLAEE